MFVGVCIGGWVGACVRAYVCLYHLLLHRKCDASYVATSARRSQACHGIFYIDV